MTEVEGNLFITYLYSRVDMDAYQSIAKSPLIISINRALFLPISPINSIQRHLTEKFYRELEETA